MRWLIIFLFAITLMWDAPPDKDLHSYAIYRREQRGSIWTAWTRIATMPKSRTSYVNKAVDKGKTYQYFVVSIDNAGNASQPSNILETVAK